jgi:LSD1 subclass zinc finger protein
MQDITIRCTACGSMIDEEDLFCPNCGTESPAKPAAASADAGDPSRIAKDNFDCKGCGASMSYDAQAKALRCPFCGSVNLVKQEDKKILSPKWVVPFAVAREKAVDAMRGWLGRGIWRPSGLAAEAEVVGMTPVYVPYWVFEAKTHAYWTADSSHTPPGARGHWYPLSGENEGDYAGVLIGASGALAPRETNAICPFDLGQGVPPEKVDLDNVTVEEFSLSRKYARPLARGGLDALETDACAANYVPGSSRNVRVNLHVTEMSSEPVLLPVWIMAYRFRDRVFRFLVNGQTGRASGEAPVSYLKIAGAILIAALVVLLVLMLAGGLKGGTIESQPPSFAAETFSTTNSYASLASSYVVLCPPASRKMSFTLGCSFCSTPARRRTLCGGTSVSAPPAVMAIGMVSRSGQYSADRFLYSSGICRFAPP